VTLVRTGSSKEALLQTSITVCGAAGMLGGAGPPGACGAPGNAGAPGIDGAPGKLGGLGAGNVNCFPVAAWPLMTAFPKSTTCVGLTDGGATPGSPGGLKEGAPGSPGAVGAAGIGMTVASCVR